MERNAFSLFAGDCYSWIENAASRNHALNCLSSLQKTWWSSRATHTLKPSHGTFLPDVLFAFCIISKERVRKSLWNFAISSLGLILKEILTLVHGKCDNGPIHYLKHFEFLSHVTQQVSTTSRSNFWEILWETVALMRQYCIRRFPWPFHFLSRRARKHWCLHL